MDLIVYRRWGHNELDEPGFTQPLMYKMIRSRDSVPRLYEKKLSKEGVVEPAAIEQIRSDCFKSLEDHFNASVSWKPPRLAGGLEGKWKNCIIPHNSVTQLDTGFDKNELIKIGKISVAYPQSFSIHPRLQKYHVERRLKDLDGDEGAGKIDWATAEAMAIGSLLRERYSCRISGQDVGRGTFSQRHLMLVDQETEKVHVPLNDMGQGQGKLEIANSSLSELAVLGYEYGCSWENPDTLYIWEAQFGDFFNGAQVIIDTFLSGGESKWMKQSGLVMLL